LGTFSFYCTRSRAILLKKDHKYDLNAIKKTGSRKNVGFNKSLCLLCFKDRPGVILVTPGVSKLERFFNMEILEENLFKKSPPSSPTTKSFHTNWVFPDQPPNDLISYLLDYSFPKQVNVIGFSISSVIWNDVEMGALQRFKPMANISGRIDVYEPALSTFPVVISEIPAIEGTPASQAVDYNRSWYNFSANSFMYYPCELKSVRFWVFAFDPLFNLPIPGAIQARTSFTIHILK